MLHGIRSMESRQLRQEVEEKGTAYSMSRGRYDAIKETRSHLGKKDKKGKTFISLENLRTYLCAIKFVGVLQSTFRSHRA